jgi:hypothetical protein
MQICGDVIGPRSWECIQSLLVGHHARLMIFFGGTCFLSMEDCVPYVF